MKPSAYLINVARAEIVDEQALYDALAGGRLAGAALDVWYRYPTSAGDTMPSTAPFHTLSNVIMTPHISGWTEGMLEARARVIAENIERTARGEAPVNAVATAG
jgi:phosphoglycerate dehydrogenase-like enzyme